MKCDEGFNRNRFTIPEYVEEQTLVDRKRDIPQIHSDLDKRAEYIRDVISMGNASRRRGKPGYLLFGIDNNWHITGIEGQSVRPKLPEDYDSNDPHKVEYLQRDTIERAFQQIASQYIAPASPKLYYHHGIVEEKRVSYLEICAEYQHETPYEVKKEISKSKRSLQTGQCWERRGESKFEIGEQEKQFLYPWIDVPYIDYRGWEGYLENLSNLPGASAENILGYQELHTSDGISLQSAFQQFIEDGTLSILQIVGRAGSGKTVFIKDRVREAARYLLEELQLLKPEIAPLEFENYIPVFFSLKQYDITVGHSFAGELLQLMTGANYLKSNRAMTPEKLFNDEGKTWLVVLDGFDEAIMTLENRAHLWGAIQMFANRFGGRVKVVITTRPDAKIADLPMFGKEIVVAPLKPAQVISFLEAQVRPALLDQFEDFLNFLNSEPELWGHLRSPLFLGTAARYVSGGEVAELSSDDDNEMFDATNSIPARFRPEEDTPDMQEETDTTEIKRIIQPIDDFINQDNDPHNETTNDTETTEASELGSEETSDEEELDIEEPWLIGKLLNYVFETLWEHNQKKQDIRLGCGEKYETFYNLGNMAVQLHKNKWLGKKHIEIFLDGSVKCIVDLGLLIYNKVKYKFPTQLSKAYFAAFFMDVSLQTTEDEFLILIQNNLNFWEKCFRLLKDITVEDTTIFEQKLDTLRKEQI